MVITEIEIWRTPIDKGETYENFKVSNLGRLINLNYYNTGKPKMMEPFDGGCGYLCVNLSKNGKPKLLRIHRLVAQTFLPNPEGKPCVNHKIEGDEGKKINMVFFNEDGTVDEKRSTIEWVTPKENSNYGTCIERSAKTRSKKVLQFTLDGEFVREWESTNECGRNGFNQRHVVNCCNGKRKTHKGFKWCYV